MIGLNVQNHTRYTFSFNFILFNCIDYLTRLHHVGLLFLMIVLLCLSCLVRREARCRTSHHVLRASGASHMAGRWNVSWVSGMLVERGRHLLTVIEHDARHPRDRHEVIRGKGRRHEEQVVTTKRAYRPRGTRELQRDVEMREVLEIQ